MWSALVLGIWLLVQPWLVWPYVAPEISHRLTLVVCCVSLGLLRFGDRGTHVPLPAGLNRWIAALLVVLCIQHVHLIRDSTYFQFFQETALFSDGLIDIIALAWGLWALIQLPRAWFRWLPWVGLAMLALNGVFALAQSFGWAWHLGSFHPVQWVPGISVSGIMGLDRFLGAYAVAWLPICVLVNPWLALIPLSLVAASGKVTAWIGATVAVGIVRPRWLWIIVPIALIGVLRFSDGDLAKKMPLRLKTWQTTAHATLEHSVKGWGVGFLTGPSARLKYGTPLPSIHSDWLALAFHFGWPLTLWALLGIRWLMRHPRSDVEAALRASLLALGAMAMIQAVLSGRIVGVALVLLAWLIVERTQEVT